MPNTYEQWTKEQHNKLKQLTETPTPNKALIGKWTKEQREKAKKLLDSWLQTHQKGNSQ